MGDEIDEKSPDTSGHKTAILVVFTLIIACSLFIYTKTSFIDTKVLSGKTEPSPIPTLISAISEEDLIKGTFSYRYQGVNSRTPLEIIVNYAYVEISLDEMGNVFVYSINGVKNDGLGKKWKFYLNDELRDVGLNTLITTNKDQIEWRYE